MNIGNIPKKIARLDSSREAIVDVSSGRRQTFGELDNRVSKLSNGFINEFRLSKGDRVAILSKNCAQFMEVVYATMRMGFIAQPLNWRLGVSELAKIVEDGAPSLIVVGKDFKEIGEELSKKIAVPNWLWINSESEDDYEKFLTRFSEQEPVLSDPVEKDDPGLILYTGGTTGESKGALHSHHSLYMGMLNQTVGERIVPTDVYMLTGQMFHIPMALAINYHAHGCPVVLINFEAKLAVETIEKERVSAFLGITTMLNWMMAVENFDSYDLSSLRNIQYGGGPMGYSVISAAHQAFPCTIIQGYGQTEGTTMTFLSQEDHESALSDVHSDRLNSCGREGFVTSVKIVDSDGNEVPRDGVTTGEIAVKSEANMLGYWQRPDLTAQTIRDGWMYTGDVAYWDKDGYVFIVDRAKDMIISGGENIYSTQVEAAILQHGGVLECAVFGIPDDEWGESVKAVVVLKPGVDASEDEIISSVGQLLASYQKPKSVDFVDALPKAPTGKILKRELRDPYWSKRNRSI